MMVRVIQDGHELTGLRVGARNARRYFPRHIPAVELQLGHLRIECGLSPDFWRGRPEIHDSRLGLWLRFKNPGAKSCRLPIRFTMIPSGDHSFAVEPAPRQTRIAAHA